MQSKSSPHFECESTIRDTPTCQRKVAHALLWRVRVDFDALGRSVLWKGGKLQTGDEKWLKTDF